MERAVDQTRSCLLSFNDGTLEVVGLEALPSEVDELADNRLVDSKYRIISTLGHGGMGVVYEAHHILLNKTVALKTFRNGEHSDEARKRFKTEAQSIARIKHPNVVGLFDFGSIENGIPYYTMEYLRGETFAQFLRRGCPPLQTTIPLLFQVCLGLTAAHSKGIVHRDLKPANIFIQTNDDESAQPLVKLVDFGIASLIQSNSGQQRLTKQGCVIGSPLYMSPEMASGQEVDQRADIYSLSCVIWEMLVGAPPIQGQNSLETILMHSNSKRPLLRQVAGGLDYPLELERLLRSMMDSEPDNRPTSVSEVANALNRIQQRMCDTPRPQRKYHSTATTNQTHKSSPRTSRPSRSRPGLIIACVSIVTLLGAGTFFLLLSTKNFRPHHSDNIVQQTRSSPPAIQARAPLTVSSEDKETFRLSFPITYQVGHFYGPEVKIHHTDSTTTIVWPKKYPPAFEPSLELQSVPQNLRAFPANSLGGFAFHDIDSSTLLHDLISEAQRFPHINQLTFNECDIPSEELTRINVFRGITHLALRNTNITANQLFALNNFNLLDEIGFGEANEVEVHKLLKRLQGSEKLRCLYLRKDKHLTREDFQAILSLKNLEQLELEETNVQNNDVAKMTCLTKLQSLDVQHTAVSGKILPVIEQMAKVSLQKFIGDPDHWIISERARLSKIANLYVSDSLRLPSSATDKEIPNWLDLPGH